VDDAAGVGRGGSILFVCEGNVCRSAFAQVVLSGRLEHLGITVSSAGTAALVDSDLDPLARSAAEAIVGPVETFLARQLTSAFIEEADVILTATREQRDLVAAQHPRTLSRLFALRDFSALLAQWDGRTVTAPAGSPSLVALLVKVAAAQRGSAPMAEAREIDVADPYRRGDAAFSRMRNEMLPSLERIETSLMALSEASRLLPDAPEAPRD